MKEKLENLTCTCGCGDTLKQMQGDRFIKKILDIVEKGEEKKGVDVKEPKLELCKTCGCEFQDDNEPCLDTFHKEEPKQECKHLEINTDCASCRSWCRNKGFNVQEPKSLKNGLTQPTTDHEWTDKQEPKSTLREEIMYYLLVTEDPTVNMKADKIISLFKDTLKKEIKKRVQPGLYVYEDDLVEIIQNL